MKKVVIVCFMIFLFSYVSAGNYYVSPTGSASWSQCTSKDIPCNLTTANVNLKAGDSAYLLGGIYTSTSKIQPTRSGDNTGNITYMHYQNDEVILDESYQDAINIENKSYIIIDGLIITNSGWSWVKIGNGDYNIIKNCYMENASIWGGITIGKGGDYNKFINNTMNAGCPCNEYCGRNYGGPQDLFWILGGNYNVIEGNKIGYSGHVAVNIQKRDAQSASYNIIRNNIFDNRWHTNFAFTQGASRNLFENNIVKNAGEEHMKNHCGGTDDYNRLRYDQHGLQINAPDNIIRENVLYNNGANQFATWQTWSECSYNRIYGNTIFKEYYGIRANSESYNHVDNIFKNNIIYSSYNYSLYHGTSAEDDGYYYFNNDISGGVNTYNYQNNPVYWKNNLDTNPSFVDTENKNFHLQSTSQMIDNGAFLTKTTHSGINSKTMKVEDVRYFMDGWGIVEGDFIQLENQTRTSKIILVNYTTNTLTLETALSWEVGKGVSLPYSGKAPDIGAFEYVSGENPPQIEICNNNIDDDGDGKADCDDSECFSDSNCQKPTGEFYKILKTNKTMIVDGDISEFNGANEIVLTNASTGAVGRYRLMWNENALYISANISDDDLNSVVATRDGSGIWNDDSIELMFDVGNNKSNSMNLDDYKFFVNINNTQLDYRGVEGNGWNISFDSAVKNSGSGYSIEIAIPWNNWNISVPVEDKTIVGFELNMNDRVSDGTRYYAVWNNSDGGSINNPSGWGEVLFSSETPISPKCTILLSHINQKMIDWRDRKCVLGDVIVLIRQWVAEGRC